MSAQRPSALSALGVAAAAGGTALPAGALPPSPALHGASITSTALTSPRITSPSFAAQEHVCGSVRLRSVNEVTLHCKPVSRDEAGVGFEFVGFEFGGFLFEFSRSTLNGAAVAVEREAPEWNRCPV